MSDAKKEPKKPKPEERRLTEGETEILLAIMRSDLARMERENAALRWKR